MATRHGVAVELDSSSRLFKVDDLVLEVGQSLMGQSIQVTYLAQAVQFRVVQKGQFLELQVFGLSDNQGADGLLLRLDQLSPNLLEGKNQIKTHRTSTLLVNGKIFSPIFFTTLSNLL